MIDAMSLLTVAGALVAAIFGILLAVLGWMGNKLYGKLVEITTSLSTLAGDLHTKINALDRRVTIVEVLSEFRRKTDQERGKIWGKGDEK